MTSMTFRLSGETRHRLRAKARKLRVTESDLLREIVERDLEDKPVGARISHLKGSVSLGSAGVGWRTALRKGNWRS